MPKITRKHLIVTFVFVALFAINVLPIHNEDTLRCPNNRSTYYSKSTHFGLPIAYEELATGNGSSCTGDAGYIDHSSSFFMTGAIIDFIPIGLALMLAPAFLEHKK
jgi:hypothetical protein